jgi:CheY-like chemotaxis protein
MGIPPEHLTRIFEPYFTTKEEGSGLGLAISYSIVRAHGGTITFSSQLGEGATLHVYLPASMRPVATATTPPAVKTRRLDGRVLLMDDDPMVADVTREMLESLGFETDVVNSGQDAVDRFVAAEQNGAPFRIVILDLTVQGAMGGADAIRHIRNVRADVHALVMSGYADNAVLAQFNEYRFDGMLPKPFALSDLRRALSID